MANPEAHRTICSANSGDMLDTDAIDRMEKLEIVELANAAYWHAVETLNDWEPGYSPGASMTSCRELAAHP